MFWAMFSPVIKSTGLYLCTVSASVHPSCCRLVSPFTVNTVNCSWWWTKHRPKHVELTWNNKLIYIVHLVGYFHSCITMNGFMNVKLPDLLYLPDIILAVEWRRKRPCNIGRQYNCTKGTKPEGNRPFGRPWRRKEHNRNTCIGKLVDRIQVSQQKDQGRPLIGTVMILRVP
jgi:hypothetical protein